MKITSTKINDIKKSFLQSLPFLAQINPNFFSREYSQYIFNFINLNLNPKDYILRNNFL